MRCPRCNETTFEPKEIELELWAQSCGKCHGVWITKSNYEKWLSSHGKRRDEMPEPEDVPRIPEFELAKVCPICRRVLIKFEVGRNLTFLIDRCNTCGGVWLEENEWETLKSRNLHDALNEIFTDHWQEEIRQEHTRRKLKKIYELKFGAEDYQKIRDFKKWMDSHEKNGEIIAYLRDKNPLQV